MADFVRVRETVPFLGKGIEDVVTAIRAVLTNHKFAQKIILEIGKPITVEKMVSADEAPTPLSVYDVLRTQPMEEYIIDTEKMPFQHLCEMAALIHSEGFELNHLLLGNKFEFQKWLKVNIPVTHMFLLGVPVVILGELEPDTFILCGSEPDTKVLEDIKFSVKGSIP